jgi:hypothetical protein
MVAKKKDRGRKIEKEYRQYFKFQGQQSDEPMPYSLRQPSPLEIVPSVATGAGYQEPIKMD